MLILGINAFHADASACLIRDGRTLVAIEEERITRRKHTAGFPKLAINACLEQTGVTPPDIDVIAISKNPTANLSGRLLQAFKRIMNPKFLLERAVTAWKALDIRAMVAEALSVPRSQIRAEYCPIEHHIAHVASAYYYGLQEPAAGVSVDGSGDFVSTLITRCGPGGIEKLISVKYPHSLGFFYTALTQFLGFPKFGDEYKVMGLSAAGKPVYRDKLKEVVNTCGDDLFRLNLDYFVHHKEAVDMVWQDGEPTLSTMYSEKLAQLLGPPRKPEEPVDQRHADISASTQAVFEDVLLHVLQVARAKTGCDVLALAGGCAQNSLANGRVPRQAGFKKVYVPPSGHDGGTSHGAALQAAVLKKEKIDSDGTPFLGRKTDENAAIAYLEKNGISWQRLEDADLFARVVDCVMDGGVVGWVQGNAEFGPRALGNRSILADPRRPDIKELLNSKIKRRESFRPFAPSVVAESAGDWFVLDETTATIPYMEKVVPVREECKAKIPAVTHVDGSARAQLVTAKFNERYWKLLTEMGRRTGVPILLNTSFNENEPIVDSEAEAIECYRRTKMDMLVIGNVMVSRKGSSQPQKN